MRARCVVSSSYNKVGNRKGNTESTENTEATETISICNLKSEICNLKSSHI